PREVFRVSQGEVADSERVKRPQRSERAVDAVATLHAEQGCDATRTMGGLDVVCGVRHDQIVRVPGDKGSYGIDLLQGRRDGAATGWHWVRAAGRRRGNVDPPELGTDATLAQPGDVRVQANAGLIARYVNRVEVLADALPELP